MEINNNANMEVSPPLDIKNKIERDLSDFRKIPQVENALEDDLQYLINNSMIEHNLYNEISTELSSYKSLCNNLFQTKMVRFLTREWDPILMEKRIGCGYNVLSFLDLIPLKDAYSDITCLDVDTGLTMSKIRNIIVKNKNISYSMQINRLVFNNENLQKFIFKHLNLLYATILRLYSTRDDIRGHTVIIYKHVNNENILFDPQMKISAKIDFNNDTGKFKLNPWKMDIKNDDPYFIQYEEDINRQVVFEFFIVNPKLDVIPQPKKRNVFIPMKIEQDIPFHMFMLVAHGESIHSDKTKTSLKFPFHSMGYFVEKNQILSDLGIYSINDIINQVSLTVNNHARAAFKMLGPYEREIPISYNVKQKYKLEEIGAPYRDFMYSATELNEVILNQTGEIDVYPMRWSINTDDPPNKMDMMGIYHMIYNNVLKRFEIVNKIVDWNFFTNGSNPISIYYSDVIKKCNEYYSQNRQTHFKKISRKLIFMGIFSCRAPAIISKQTDIARLYKHSISPETDPNVADLRRHIIERGDAPRIEGGTVKSAFKLKMVNQDDFLKYNFENKLIQNQNIALAQSEPPPVIKTKSSRKTTRKNREKNKRKSIRKIYTFG
jgi:hypothetical protein